MSGQTRIRVGSSWVEPSQIYHRSGGTWNAVQRGYVYRNGAWRQIWPPRQPATTDIYDSTETALWHDFSDGWHGGTWGTSPEQGAHPSGSNHRGLWFYGNRPWQTALNQDGGRRVTKIEIYLRRVSGHQGPGPSGGVRPRLYAHGFNSRPNSKPALFGGPFLGPPIAAGGAAWVELPVGWGPWLVSGRARGFAVFAPEGGPYSAYQSRDATDAAGRLRITHE
jgi:hypothetical protein